MEQGLKRMREGAWSGASTGIVTELRLSPIWTIWALPQKEINNNSNKLERKKNERKERLTQPKATIDCVGSELPLHPTWHLSQYVGITDTWSLYFRHRSHCQCRRICTQEPRTHSVNAHLVHIDPSKQQVHVCPAPRVVDIYTLRFFYLFLIVCICGGCAFLLQCVCDGQRTSNRI